MPWMVTVMDWYLILLLNAILAEMATICMAPLQRPVSGLTFDTHN